jgi:hypothetical protein
MNSQIAHRLVRVVLGVIGVSYISIAILVSGVAAQDPRLEQCGANIPGNKVLTSFELPRARDFWSRFPTAGRAPELETDQPAFVVVFNGPASHFVVGTWIAGQDPDVRLGLSEKTVCVVAGSEVNVYANVDMAGFRP